MKVYSITFDMPELDIYSAGNKYYRLTQDASIVVHTDLGVFVFKFKDGFLVNCKCGCFLVEALINRLSRETRILLYLLHYALYIPCKSCDDKHPLTRLVADRLLKATLAWAGVPSILQNVAYFLVRIFGSWEYAEYDCITATNTMLFSFGWVGRK